MTPPLVWTIAGTDPTGGAGIQADLKTMHGLEAYGCSVVTAVLAQNSSQVSAVEIMPDNVVTQQLAYLQQNYPPQAIKVGMLGNRGNVRAVTEALETLDTHVVCDPVLISSSGRPLLEASALELFSEKLLPQVDVLTPNIPEAETLLGRSIRDPRDMEQAGRELLRMGPKAILVKGGHANGATASDCFVHETGTVWLHSARLDVQHTHGTGCTFSSALACGLAHDMDRTDAIVMAKAYVNQGLRLGGGLDVGRGALAHLTWPNTPNDLPWLSDEHETRAFQFPTCTPAELGFYPVVDSVDWVHRLLQLGVRTLQLRIKETAGHDLEKEIAEAIGMANSCKARLYINDHWELALAHGAYGVHLGQDDLAPADLEQLARAGLRLGISTHSYAEIARAWAVRPSYIALGTLFESPSKSFAHRPLGLALFRRLRRLIPVPTVAIGGITLERANDVLEAGADGIAVISAVTASSDVASAVSQWLEHIPSTAENAPEISASLQ